MRTIGVAISAFRSDDQVIGLIRQITEERWPIQGLIVVDSQGSGKIESHIRENGLQDQVTYFNSETNLGSAGNLEKRLRMAADLGMDFVLALNHDAVATWPSLELMLRSAELPHVGALYPLRFRTGKQLFDLTGVTDFSFRVRGSAEPPTRDLVEVTWSSSNGALYSTAPLRERGVCPDGMLWMGWEDYEYGLQLRRAGYQQYIVTAARTTDNYEYKQSRVMGRDLTLADKPVWYMYYSVRNLLAISLYRSSSLGRSLKALMWAGSMLVHVWTANGVGGRRNAFSAYVRGIRDGLLNRTGKWIYP